MFSAMEPARSIIKKLGGEAVVSEITGTAYTAPYRWQHARDKGGTGGFIPQKYHRTILDYAREHGIDLNPAELIEPALPVSNDAQPAAAEPGP